MSNSSSSSSNDDDDNDDGDDDSNDNDDDDDDDTYNYNNIESNWRLCVSVNHKVSLTRSLEVAMAHSCAKHVQHIGRPSRTTCRVPPDKKGSSAIKSDSWEIVLILADTTDRRRVQEETGVPGENPAKELQKMSDT